MGAVIWGDEPPQRRPRGSSVDPSGLLLRQRQHHPPLPPPEYHQSVSGLSYYHETWDKASSVLLSFLAVTEDETWFAGRAEQTTAQGICRCSRKAEEGQQPMSHQQSREDILWLRLLLCKQEDQSSDSQAQVKASVHVSSPRPQPRKAETDKLANETPQIGKLWV